MRRAVGDQPGQQGLALVAVHRRGAHLDELVRGEGALHFREHRVGDALAAEIDHGIQCMRPRLERLAFRR